jgi:hypothetical protein
MRSSYIEILTEKVEIPIIQRDYAQGRTDNKTNKIRKDFFDVLFDFINIKIKDPNAQIELDFIYGFNEGDEKVSTEFVPIDGQQRLTTLWLLYWFVGTKENIAMKDMLFLSNFVYETRHSTTQFCKELISYSANFKYSSIGKEIKDQSWYFETWDYDPSIQAMLVVLDDIENRYDQIGLTNVWHYIGNNSCPFYFYKLDMKKVGLTDDLYIKMNSRGKPLTEFEYFKAGFTELIIDANQRKRFETSIDGKWIDTIWQIVNESETVIGEDDIALTVDNAFLNLFNFITSVIAFRKEITTIEGKRYTNTINSSDLLATIYTDSNNQDFLFDTLDAVCHQQDQNAQFWSNTFYFGQASFDTLKTRLFFQHNEQNLLKRCLFNFSENRGFSYPEQLLLIACLTEFKNPQREFTDRIRTIRNLVSNSDNELRESIIGNSFDEVEKYIINGDLNILKNFKTDQIDQERQKASFLANSLEIKSQLQKLEDSDILRGSISIFPLDRKFGKRVKMFFIIFNEDDFITRFNQKSNLLLCFGDYSQDEGSLTNLMAGSKSIIRNFLTTPGFNKDHFTTRTRVALTDCLDYFNDNPTVTPDNKISNTLCFYKTNPKDWRYYFLKYNSFRDHCNYGYYQWKDNEYCFWKMGKKQFNGYHWDPFLFEIQQSIQQGNLNLEPFGNKLLISQNGNSLEISSINNGFLIENSLGDSVTSNLMDDLKSNGTIDNTGTLVVPQNSEGLDLEDRIEILKNVLLSLVN